MVMCFDFYPEAGGWLASECLLLLVSMYFGPFFESEEKSRIGNYEKLSSYKTIMRFEVKNCALFYFPLYSVMVRNYNGFIVIARICIDGAFSEVYW